MLMCLRGYHIVILDNAFLCHSKTDEQLYKTNKQSTTIFVRSNCMEYDCEIHNINHYLIRVFPLLGKLVKDYARKLHMLGLTTSTPIPVGDTCMLYDSAYELYARRYVLRSIAYFNNYPDVTETLPSTIEDLI